MTRISLTEDFDDRSVIAKLNEMNKRLEENTSVVTSAEESARQSAQSAQETADRFAGSVGAVVQNANQQINASKTLVDQAKADVDETVSTVAQAVQTANQASASAQQSATTVSTYGTRLGDAEDSIQRQGTQIAQLDEETYGLIEDVESIRGRMADKNAHNTFTGDNRFEGDTIIAGMTVKKDGEGTKLSNANGISVNGLYMSDMLSKIKTETQNVAGVVEFNADPAIRKNNPKLVIRNNEFPASAMPSQNKWAGIRFTDSGANEIGSVTYNRDSASTNLHVYLKRLSGASKSFKFWHFENGNSYLEGQELPDNAPSNAYVTKGFVSDTAGRNNLIHTIGNEYKDGLLTVKYMTETLRFSSGTSGWKEVLRSTPEAHTNFSGVAGVLGMFILDKSNNHFYMSTAAFRTSSSYTASTVTAPNETDAANICITQNTDNTVSIWYAAMRVSVYPMFLEKASTTGRYAIASNFVVGTRVLSSKPTPGEDFTYVRNGVVR